MLGNIFQNCYYSPVIKVFIDESGNLGRGGRYFVLAATVFQTDKGAQRAKRVIRKAQQHIASTHPTRHFPEIKSCILPFPERQRILNKMISRADLDLFYLVVDKSHVSLLRQGKPKNLIYNYFAKLLTDQIFAKYNDDFHVIFDQRSTSVKSMNSLPDYIMLNAYTQHQHLTKTVEVKQMDSRTAYNLQAADVIAGTIYRAYNLGNPHFLNLIRPRVVKAEEFPQNHFDGRLWIA